MSQEEQRRPAKNAAAATPILTVPRAAVVSALNALEHDDQERAAEILRAVLEGNTVIPSGALSGRMLAEVLRSSEGREWLRWAVDMPGGFWPPGFRRSLMLFAPLALQADEEQLA